MGNFYKNPTTNKLLISNKSGARYRSSKDIYLVNYDNIFELNISKKNGNKLKLSINYQQLKKIKEIENFLKLNHYLNFKITYKINGKDKVLNFDFDTALEEYEYSIDLPHNCSQALLTDFKLTVEPKNDTFFNTKNLETFKVLLNNDKDSEDIKLSYSNEVRVFLEFIKYFLPSQFIISEGINIKDYFYFSTNNKINKLNDEDFEKLKVSLTADDIVGKLTIQYYDILDNIEKTVVVNDTLKLPNLLPEYSTSAFTHSNYEFFQQKDWHSKLFEKIFISPKIGKYIMKYFKIEPLFINENSKYINISITPQHPNSKVNKAWIEKIPKTILLKNNNFKPWLTQKTELLTKPLSNYSHEEILNDLIDTSNLKEKFNISNNDLKTNISFSSNSNIWVLEIWSNNNSYNLWDKYFFHIPVSSKNAIKYPVFSTNSIIKNNSNFNDSKKHLNSNAHYVANNKNISSNIFLYIILVLFLTFFLVSVSIFVIKQIKRKNIKKFDQM